MTSVAHANATIRLRQTNARSFELRLVQLGDDEVWVRRAAYSGVQYRLAIDRHAVCSIMWRGPTAVASIRVGQYVASVDELITCSRSAWTIKARKVAGPIGVEFMLALDRALRLWPNPQPLKDSIHA